MVGDQEIRKALRLHRSHIRAAIEDAATAQDMPGVCSAFVVFAEIASMEDGEPCRSMFMDASDASDYGIAPWTLRGLVDYGMESMDHDCIMARFDAEDSGD
jgi:hypothetical protein